MTRNTLSDLSSVTGAIFDREYQSLRPILDAERRIQNQLARLDMQLQQVRAESTRNASYAITGTDMLWHGWESATRRKLNMELARVRASKIAAMNQLRAAFGRKQAVAELNRINSEHRRLAKLKSQAQQPF